MRLTDGRSEAEIKMVGINGIEWTEDFYNAGALQMSDDGESYLVDDVQDAIDAAVDYCKHEGDYSDITDTETKVYLNGELIAECEEA